METNLGGTIRTTVPIDRDVLHRSKIDPRNRQALFNGPDRKPGRMLDPHQPLLLNRRKEFTVTQ